MNDKEESYKMSDEDLVEQVVCYNPDHMIIPFQLHIPLAYIPWCWTWGSLNPILFA